MLVNILIVLWGILAIAAFSNMMNADVDYRKEVKKEEVIFMIILIAPFVLIGIDYAVYTLIR